MMPAQRLLRIGVLASVIAAAGLSGCATTNYERIDHKIAAYDQKKVSVQSKLDTTTDPARRVAYLNTLVEITDRQLAIARRADPETIPARTSGSITREQAIAQKDELVHKLEAARAEYVRERDALVANPTPAAK